MTALTLKEWSEQYDQKQEAGASSIYDATRAQAAAAFGMAAKKIAESRVDHAVRRAEAIAKLEADGRAWRSVADSTPVFTIAQWDAKNQQAHRDAIRDAVLTGTGMTQMYFDGDGITVTACAGPYGAVQHPTPHDCAEEIAEGATQVEKARIMSALQGMKPGEKPFSSGAFEMIRKAEMRLWERMMAALDAPERRASE